MAPAAPAYNAAIRLPIVGIIGRRRRDGRSLGVKDGFITSRSLARPIFDRLPDRRRLAQIYC